MNSPLYPLDLAQPWPNNQWWVAANAAEIGQTPIERTLLGEPVVLFRTEAGEPVAMSGICPHRGYPMVRAQRRGDALQCAYHGFTFDAHGACVRIPSQPDVPPSWRIRTYPLVQRWEWVWIWMGEPELADPASIPDAWCVDKPGWRSRVSDLAPLKARYTMLIDNLLDLSHLHFVHGTTVGNSTEVVETPLQMSRQHDDMFRIARAVDRRPWSDIFSLMFPQYAQTAPAVHNVVFTDYYGPALTIAGLVFHLQSPRERLGEVNFLHACTPETEHSTHYFGGVTRDFRVDDPTLDGPLLQGYHAVRNEDLEVIAATEQYGGRFLSTHQELSARQDAGGIRVRRLLAAQIQAEQQPRD